MEKIGKILFVLLIMVVAAFAYVLLNGSLFVGGPGIINFEGKENDFYVPAVEGANIPAYKNSCKELNLSQVLKDPYSLVGQKVKLNGQIIEKKEYEQFGKMRTSLVLKVPELLPDPYIFVSYTGTIPFKQVDIITVYGVYSYPVQADNPPEIRDKLLMGIKAGYIEKK